MVDLLKTAPVQLALSSLLLLPAVVCHAQQSSTEAASNDIEIVLPATALLTSLVREDWRGAREFGIGLAATIASVYTLKRSIRKDRPDLRDDDSFPSGHTAVTFHSAVYLHKRYGVRWALPAYAAAGWVGYSRIYANRHDTADVLAGAAIGALAARFLTTRHDDFFLVPEIGGDYVGVQISFRR